MEISPVAIGAISAAVITSLLSLVGLIISKENKTSEFRQQWIDSFREEISELIGRLEVILLHGRLLDFEVKKNGGDITPQLLNDVLEKIKDEVKEAHSLHRKILLRLNPSEHQNIRSIMDDVATVLRKTKPEEAEINTLLNKLVETIQKELKKEWTRVKAGEPVFRITKWFVCVFLTATLMMTAYLVFSAKPASSSKSSVDGMVQKQASSAKRPLADKIMGH